MDNHRRVADPNPELLLLPIAILVVMFVLAVVMGQPPAGL